MGCYIKSRQKHWYGAKIPYFIDDAVNNKSRVRNAIKHWKDNTVARLVGRTNQSNYIKFVQTNKDASSSAVGKQGGMQEIKLGKEYTKRTAIHEIGHAIGLRHEHQRPDRDNYVKVYIDRVIDGRKHNFTKYSTSTTGKYGPYDYQSRMHYPSGAFAKELRYDWTAGWSSVEFYYQGGTTYLLLLKKSGLASDNNNVHIHRINTDRTVGSKIKTYKWSEGWTQAKIFKVGGNVFLFLLKEIGAGSDGKNVHIHRINADGSVGTKIATYDWTSGWTTAEFYQVGSTTYLFLLKKSGTGSDNKNVHLHKMNSDGKVGTKIAAYDWTSGWTSAEFYQVGSNLYLFLLKVGNGHVHMHDIKYDGKVGTELRRIPTIEALHGNVINSSTNLTSGDIGAANTILRGNVHIHKINTNGKIGSKIDVRSWTKGWTIVRPFFISNKQYLFLLKEIGAGSDGKNVHIHRINADGSVGTKIATYDWTSGWTTAEFYQVGSTTYLFLLKKSGTGSDNKNVHLHKMNSDGKVGTKIAAYDWTSGWTTAEFYQVGSNLYLFLLKVGNGHVHIHRINNNGKVGTEIVRYDWSSGWTTVEFYETSQVYLFLLKSVKD